MNNSFYSRKELHKINFKNIGENVLISRHAKFYGVENIEIGNNVRIDDFCVISPGSSLCIGNYIHIASFILISGKGNVIIKDFASISGRVSIYSSGDNYLGWGMTNPMVPYKYRRVENGDIIVNKHAIIGAGSVILPNTELGEGCSIGALSLVKGKFKDFAVYSGVPAKQIGKRIKSQIAIFEQELINNC